MINIYLNRQMTQKYKSIRINYQKHLGNSSIPLMPDGTMSMSYLQNVFTREVEQRDAMIERDDWIDYSTIEKDLAIYAIYWKSSDGKREEKELIVQDGRVLPPESGWFTRPTWAFDGPHYHLETKKFNLVRILLYVL